MLTLTNVNKSNKSKSQKRKQRLLNKGKQIAISSNLAVSTNRKPSKRRNRSKRRSGSMDVRGNNATYLQSLMDPEMGEGAKIPDLVAFPSGSFQLTYQGVLSTAASTGDTVAIKFVPIVGDGSTSWPIFRYGSATAGAFGTATNTSWSARAATAAAYDLFRPVSASVEFFFIGNSTADGGRICGGCIGTTTAGAISTYIALENAPETDEWAVRNGMKVLWKPLDQSNFSYSNVDGDTPTIQNYPYIWIAATGLPAGTVSIGFKVVCNFEAIPSLSYYDLVDSTPSPFDQSMLRRAFEWAAESGNNILAMSERISPYVQAGANVARAIGWNPLPQRTFGKKRRGVGPRLSLADVSRERPPHCIPEGKEEEEHEIDVAEAEKIFSQLAMTEKPSPSTVLRIATPKGSPIAIRKAGGQV